MKLVQWLSYRHETREECSFDFRPSKSLQLLRVRSVLEPMYLEKFLSIGTAASKVITVEWILGLEGRIWAKERK